jgi:predicted RND superfamily exporter protein
MAFVLSVGFAVEYSVHIVARFLKADIRLETGLDRVKYTMSCLMLPTVMSFGASLIGVICLAFTKFEFNFTFFFKPLIILMFVTYFYGCWWLPAMLTLVNWDIVKFGLRGAVNSSNLFLEDSVKGEAKAPATKISHAAAVIVEDSLGSEELAEA